MKQQFLEMARITKPIGLKGEMRAQVFCDYAEQLAEYETLYLGKEHEPISVTSSRVQKNEMAAIKISGVESIEEAQRLSGKMIYLNRDDADLPDDVWFLQDIIGAEVLDADSGKRYGVIDDVLQNGAADVYSIKTDEGKQLLFPAIPEVLVDVDIDNGKMTIRPLPNLFELEGERDE